MHNTDVLLNQQSIVSTEKSEKRKLNGKVHHPFRVLVQKEVSEQVRSWKFIILLVIIALTCLGSLYTSLTNIGQAIKPNDPEADFLFLKLFTLTDGSLPSYISYNFV